MMAAALALVWRLDKVPLAFALPNAGFAEVLVFASGTACLLCAIWLPVALPLLDGLAAIAAALGVRYPLDERALRRIRAAFCHYLAPSLVARLVDSEAELHLRGERREVIIMFADLTGFTAMSTRLPPDELMALTNSYHAHGRSGRGGRRDAGEGGSG
jgi:adenylate cyclase